jgi:8-oxo-dGTP pyrophosphatase MutT (NUDIX family)
VKTALRETQEETGIIIPPEAIFPLVYRITFEHNGLLMNYYMFIAQLDGAIPVTLSGEHLAWGFFNEKEVQSFGTFDKEKARQRKHVMLESKKRTLCHIFINKERLKNGDERILYVDR